MKLLHPKMDVSDVPSLGHSHLFLHQTPEVKYCLCVFGFNSAVTCMYTTLKLMKTMVCCWSANPIVTVWLVDKENSFQFNGTSGSKSVFCFTLENKSTPVLCAQETLWQSLCLCFRSVLPHRTTPGWCCRSTTPDWQRRTSESSRWNGVKGEETLSADRCSSWKNSSVLLLFDKWLYTRTSSGWWNWRDWFLFAFPFLSFVGGNTLSQCRWNPAPSHRQVWEWVGSAHVSGVGHRWTAQGPGWADYGQVWPGDASGRSEGRAGLLEEEPCWGDSFTLKERDKSLTPQGSGCISAHKNFFFFHDIVIFCLYKQHLLRKSLGLLLCLQVVYLVHRRVPWLIKYVTSLRVNQYDEAATGQRKL